MTVLKVLEFPDPRLRNKAKPVTEFDDNLKQFIKDMFDTLYNHENGAGLAATQVNVAKQVIVIDAKERGVAPLVLINPEIIEKSGTTTYREGCLSVPDIFEDVVRAEHIKVRTFDADGKERIFETGDFLAICIQHEIDHLNGKLFIDYLSPVKRDRVRRLIKKIKKAKKL